MAWRADDVRKSKTIFLLGKELDLDIRGVFYLMDDWSSCDIVLQQVSNNVEYRGWSSFGISTEDGNRDLERSTLTFRKGGF